MNIPPLRSTCTRIPLIVALAGALILASFAAANGQKKAAIAKVNAPTSTTTTFGQFFERYGDNDFKFAFCNSVDPANTGLGIHARFETAGGVGGVPIYFTYQNVSGLTMGLRGPQRAHLVVTSTTGSGATNVGINLQPIDGTTTIQVIRDSPMDIGNGPKANLLTVNFTGIGANYPMIAGVEGGNSANLQASTPNQAVSYTSDFLDFSNPGSFDKLNAALSFSSVSPGISISPVNSTEAATSTFLQDFTAAGSGTFASNPAPLYLGPAAGSIWVSGRVMTNDKASIGTGPGVGGAEVILTEGNGNVHVVTTTPLGYFRIDGITAGQTAMLAIQSKLYNIDPQLLILNDSIDELIIIAQR